MEKVGGSEVDDVFICVSRGCTLIDLKAVRRMW